MSVREFQPLQPKRVLGIVAHPDDIDVSAAGAIAKYIQQGAEVLYLILTDGGKGSDDQEMTTERLIRLRQDEQREALRLLGGKPENVHFFAYGDGELENTMSLKRDIVREIRLFKPDVVITLDPTVIYSKTTGRINHPDHRAAGQAVLDAVFPLARDRLTFPEFAAAGIEPHKVETVLLVDFDSANYYEDVTDTYALKEAAIHAHASQFSDEAYVQRLLRGMAEEAGSRGECMLAEGFIRLDIG